MFNKNHNQHRIIIAGLAQRDVGLTNVLNAIAEELKYSWEVLVFAHGIEANDYIKVKGVKTEVSLLQDWSKSTQIHFENTIKNYSPDVILIIGHPWKSPNFTAIAAKYSNAKLAVYMPIEGRPLGNDIYSSLSGVDLCITYTEFTKNALKDLLGNQGPKLINIGHGLDNYYKPISKNNLPSDYVFKQKLRQKLFPNNPEYWKRPMLLNSNRSYYRKRLDLTIEAFATATKEIDASLYLNVAALSYYEGNKLEKLIHKLGVENRVMLNTLNIAGKLISKEQLLKLYNACDVGITTSMGEGWGLCVFEHAATGAAQIVPNHTSFSENWPNETAVKFTANKPIFLADEAAEMYEANPIDICNAIKSMVANSSHIKKYGRNGFEHVNSEKFKWKTIGDKFDIILKNLTKPQVLYKV